MKSKIYQINNLPTGWGTFWHAVRKPIRTFDPTGDIERLDIDIPIFNFDLAHFSEFITVFQSELKGRNSKTFIPAIYPMTLVYPIMLRAVSMSSITIPMMLSMVSIKSEIKCYQAIRPDWTFNVRAGFQEIRSTQKGLEFDFNVNLISRNEMVWKNINTLFFRGVKLKNQSLEKGFLLDPIEKKSNQFLIGVNRKTGKSFCKLMGDSNAIHTNRLFARLMGYQNAFSQPYHALGNVLMKNDWLSILRSAGKFYFEFKGPLYYNQWVKVKYNNDNGKLRFDLYSGENPRPGILGSFKIIESTI